MEGWAETWAGHRQGSGEKGAHRDETAAALATKQTALVFHLSLEVFHTHSSIPKNKEF